MSVYFELSTEIADDQFKKLAGSVAGKANVRRPLRGLELKDETYAYIKLVRRDGLEIELLDSSSASGRSTEYSNFILQSVVDQRMEKQQLLETFGSDYLMLFGQAPHFLQISATLVNSLDFNWEAEFMENYDRYMRGTKAIEAGCRTYLFYDSNIVEGYILNASVQKTADIPMMVPLQFQFFVTNFQNISVSDDTGLFPVRASMLLPDGVNLYSGLNGEQIDLLTQSTPDGFQGGFTEASTQRAIPLRSRIIDNYDEYTSPTAGQQVFEDYNQSMLREQDVDDLNSTLGDVLSAYGADPASAFSPNTAGLMGIGPTFSPAGVGIGIGGGISAGATFGASASAGAGFGLGGGIGGNLSSGLGGFAGVGGSAMGGGFAGYGAGLGAGASAGVGIGGRGLYSEVDTYGAVGSSFGGGAFGAAQSGYYPNSFAYNSRGAASGAGGYANANASLGSYGGRTSVSSSYAGSSGAGGAVSIGGQPSAFAFGAIAGDFTNGGLSAYAALQAGGSAGFGAGYSL